MEPAAWLVDWDVLRAHEEDRHAKEKEVDRLLDLY